MRSGCAASRCRSRWPPQECPATTALLPAEGVEHGDDVGDLRRDVVGRARPSRAEGRAAGRPPRGSRRQAPRRAAEGTSIRDPVLRAAPARAHRAPPPCRRAAHRRRRPRRIREASLRPGHPRALIRRARACRAPASDAGLVLLAGAAADADRADERAVDQDGHAAGVDDDAPAGGGVEAPVDAAGLGGALELAGLHLPQRGGVRLVHRELGRAQRSAVHACEGDQIAGAVAHGERCGDALAAGRLAHGSEDRLGEIEADLAVRDEAVVIHPSVSPRVVRAIVRRRRERRGVQAFVLPVSGTCPTDEIPVIDLAPSSPAEPERAAVVDAVRAACEEIGFFCVTGARRAGRGHRRARRATRGRSSTSPTRPSDASGKSGEQLGGVTFSPLASEALAASRGERTPGDLKQMLDYGPGWPGDAWPAEPAGLRERARAVLRRAQRARGRTCARSSRSPPDCPENAFEARRSATTSRRCG